MAVNLHPGNRAVGTCLPQLMKVGARGAHGCFSALDVSQSSPSCAVFHLPMLPERSVRKILLAAANKLPFNYAMVGLYFKIVFY